MLDEVEYKKPNVYDVTQSSAKDDWPTKLNSSNLYKLTSFWIEYGKSLTEIERTTYSILDLLGDVGGLFDGLRILCKLLVSPFAVFAAQSFMLNRSLR